MEERDEDGGPLVLSVQGFEPGTRVTIRNMPVFRRSRWWEFWRPRWREIGREDREYTVGEGVTLPTR